MRRSFTLAALALVLGTSGLAVAGVGKGDRPAEFIQVSDAGGHKVALSKFKDEVVVVTFGASWCEPCRKELPALEKLARTYVGKKVQFIAINIDNELAKGKKFAAQSGLKTVLVGFDTKKSTVEAYDPPKMPSIFIIRGGVVREIHAGYTAGDENGIAKLIDQQLAAL